MMRSTIAVICTVNSYRSRSLSPVFGQRMISPTTTLCFPFGWRRINAGTTGDLNLREKTAGPSGVDAVRPRKSMNAPPGPPS